MLIELVRLGTLDMYFSRVVELEWSSRAQAYLDLSHEKFQIVHELYKANILMLKFDLFFIRAELSLAWFFHESSFDEPNTSRNQYKLDLFRANLQL